MKIDTQSKLKRLKADFFIGFNVWVALVFLTILPSTTQAAQFIDSLPTDLKGNWTICHFLDHKSSAKDKINIEDWCFNSHSLNIEQMPRSATMTVDSNLLIEKNYPLLLSNHSNFQSLIGQNYSTYTKQFIVNGELQRTALAIHVDSIDEADEIRVNGYLIGKTGNFPPIFQGAFRQSRIYNIPSFALKYNQFNLIEIKSFNSIDQPGLNGVDISLTEHFQTVHKQQTINYAYVACISILLLLAFNQVVHFLIIKGSNEVLYLAFFLFTFAFVTFFRSHIPSTLGFDLSSIFKVEVFLLYMALIAILFFLFKFNDFEIRNYYGLAFIFIGVLGVLNLIWPFESSIRLVAEISYWMVIILAFLTGGSAILVAWLKKRKFAQSIAVFIIFSWCALVFDSLMQSQFILYSKLPNYPLLLSIAAVIVGTGMTVAVTQKYWQLIKGATYDHLTGTLLRPSFFQRLSEELQRSQKNQSLLLVAVIQISQFKSLKSDYGYNVANNLLLSVADSLNRQLNPYDLICHLSDDQFCIAATLESRLAANQFIEKTHKEITSLEHQVENDSKIFIDVKIGSIIYNPDHHLSVSQLIQDANYGLARVNSKEKVDFILLNNPTVKA